MHMPTINIAPAAARDRTIRIVTLGFIADPMARWTWPDADDYLKCMPKFIAAFAGQAFARGSAYVADDGRAAALWLPPGAAPDGDAIEALFAATTAPDIHDDLAAVFEQMDAYHPTDRPHWYLPLIAADPAYLARGLGAALMTRALERCDEDGLIAYLESSNPRNLSLYERHGFEIIGKIQAGTSPTLYPMIREARR